MVVIGSLSFVAKGQAVGDYRTRGAGGNWNTLNTWQRYNGGAWVIPTAGEGYPGENAGTGLVTIRNNDFVTLNVSPANPIGSMDIRLGNEDSYLTFSGTNSLEVTGQTRLRSNSTGDHKAIFVDGGTFTTGSLEISSGNNNNRDAYIRISTGEVYVLGDADLLNTGRRTYILFTGSGTLFVGGNMSGGTITSTAGGHLTDPPTSGTVNYYGISAQQIGAYTYHNLETSNGDTKTLVGATTVNNNLILTSGVLQIGNNDLTIVNTANNAIQGAAYSATNMIETDGTGYLIRSETTPVPIEFPIGSGGYYSPTSITAISPTTAGTISVRAVPDLTLGSNYLDKYFDVIASITGRTITATFAFDAAEIPNTPTDIYVNTGTWSTPTGTQSFTATSFTITNTTDIVNTSTLWTAEAVGISDTYFSYQTGPWNVSTTWTSDPGGTTQVGTTVPGNGDVVVILSGRTVSLTEDCDSANLEVNINDGGILDMATFAFSDAGGLNELNGQGKLRLASTSFPTVTTNTFVNTGGGTTEYYNAADFTLPVAQTTYNHLEINATGVIATQMSDITLNGDLKIEQGTFRINDNTTAARRQLTINGDVTVDAGASFSVGTGVTNTQTSPLNIASVSAAPFIEYYDAQSHRIVFNGDFTNNGSVRFTNLAYPIFDSFPPTVQDATTGFASVYFRGATDNTLICNNTTDFYNIIIDKGIDQSFSLTVYSSGYQNFRLFGANTAGGDGGGSNPNLKKALWIRTGTLKLQGQTIIPSLSEGTCAEGGADPNSDYFIPANGALVLDGTEVVVLSTADDYREINVAYTLAAPSDVAIGVGQGGCSSFSVLGKFQVNNGYFSTRESGGIITWDDASGQFVINGGTIDAKQFRSAGAGGGLASFDQSGGTFILRGRFQHNLDYSSIAALKYTTVNTVRANAGSLGATLGTFNLNEAENVFTMSGGTIRIYDVCGDGSVVEQQKVFEVESSAGNINVTDGTLQILLSSGSGGVDSPIYRIRSNAALGNVNILRPSGTSTVQLDTYPLTVLKNLSLTSGELISNNLDVSIGGTFLVSTGTTYTPGTNWTIFNGTGSQSLAVNLATTFALKKLKIDKPSGTTLTLGGTQSTISVEDSLMILNGNLADGGKTIDFKTSTTSATSYLYNSGIHSGAGKIMLSDDDPQVITGDGSGVFQNLDINNTNALAAPVSLGANITVNGTLTFSQDKLFDINTNNITLGALSSIANASATRYIQSAGNAGDGGVTKTYSTTSTSFDFPIGAPSTGHAATEYTPATLSFGTNPTTYGSITIIPVGYEHPNTTNKGRSLTYFWRTKSSGFVMGVGTLTHSYTYSQNDVVTGGDINENEYLAASYDNTTYTWTKGVIADVDDAVSNIIGGAGTTLAGVTYIDGEFTAGDDGATDPFGTPVVYYSRQTGLWSDVNTWSLTDHLTDNPPGVVPGASDVVIIGGQDSVYLSNEVPPFWDFTNPNPAGTYYQLDKAVVNSASLQIETGSVLDIQNNPGCNFGIVLNHASGNGKIRITTRNAANFDSQMTFAFPSGDFSDFNVNLGSTELYTVNAQAGTVFWLPNGIISYGNLIISPYGGSNIIFPNHDLLIYGNLTAKGENSESWYCPSWRVSLYPTVPTVPVGKTITINGNFDLQGGAFVYYNRNNTGAQDFVIDGDLIINTDAGIQVYTNGTANTQSISIGGSLINNSLAPGGGVDGYRGGDFGNIPLTFFGASDEAITNTSGTTNYTIFDDVTINKGTSQTDTLTIDIDGTLTTPTNNWLTLQNGTLKYSRTDPSSDFTITTTSTFTIPSTAGLYIDYPDNATGQNILIANAASNTNDVFLNGKLTLVNGDVYIGRTNGTDNNNNDIEYSGGGASAIDIQGGSLIVNGQVRRNPATTNGVLSYTQSAGDVVINGQNAITSNAKLEVCNAGSVFDMSGGTLTIVRGGGTTYGDLYLRAASSSVTGGEIVFTQSPSIGPVVDAVQDYILDAQNLALNDLTITGKTAGTARNATVTLFTSDLVMNGDLTISNANSIFDANTNYDIQVTIKGGFTNDGLYNHYNNLTIFSGGAQSIQGSTATTFYDLLVNPVTSLSLIRDITIYNDLTLSSGQLLGSTFNINVEGDVINNANYDGDVNQGGVILNGTGLQHVSGTGTFGRLELNNSDGATLDNDITLQKNFKLTNGIFNLGEYQLTLSVSSSIEGTSFGPTKMITTNGVFSDFGLRKYYDVYSGADQIFIYPMGTSGKYTPAKLTYSDNGQLGFIRVICITGNHPGVIDPNNVLDYWWELESESITGFNGSLDLKYEDSDVQVTGVNTEADYIAARLIIEGTSWSKAAPGPGTDNVDEVNDTITFEYSGTDNLSGEYSAGIDVAIPDDVPAYRTYNNDVWSNELNWEQVAGDTFPCPAGGPNGFISEIAVDDTVTLDANYASAYRIEINGKLIVPAATFGHNLGTVSGSGTLYLENGTFPAGRYTDFFDCSNNATLEYSGSTDYTLIADLYSTIPNLHFTGTGTRTLPNKDLTICTQLLIDGPTLDNSVNNKKLTIQGTMERYNTGAFISGTGAGAVVSFEGSAAQTIGGVLGDFTGANDFNYLEINNSAGLTINAGGAIEVAGNLLLTDGNITTSATNTLTITNTPFSSVTPLGGSAASFVDGPLIKKINTGDDFLFPIGKGTELGNKLTVSSTQPGPILWTAEYFTPNATSTSVAAPLSYVNSMDYWTVSAASGSEAVVELDWDPASDLTPLMTQNGLTDMRVANYNTGTTNWEEVASTASGTDSDGTVETTSRITIPAAGSSDYTLACINTTKPRARLDPPAAVCGGDGIPVTFTVSFPINFDYILNYEKGGVAQPPVTVSALPYTLPTDATGTTYQLTGFTYNDPASPTSGVVDPTIVTTYTVPTTADAGLDQSDCGATTTALEGNDPLVGSGQWNILSGLGGTVVSPTVFDSDFNGTNGTTYELEWVISNGSCVSRDTVIIAFPLNPVQPGLFIVSSTNVCRGEQDVIYTVSNDPTVTYDWAYSGTGETITEIGPGNSASVDFDASATSGTLGVTATNGCGTSLPREVDITVNLLPTAYNVTGGGPYCTGGAGVAIGLDASAVGVDYTLFRDGFTTGITVAGINAVISFGNQTVAGNYTVEAVNATTLCSQTMNGSKDITVNPLPVATLTANAALDTICTGDNTEIEIDFTVGAGPYNFTITDGTTPESLVGIAADPYTYTPAVAPVWIDGGSNITTDYFYMITTITDSNGCTSTNLGNEKVTVFKIPETGPQNHIEDTWGN